MDDQKVEETMWVLFDEIIFLGEIFEVDKLFRKKKSYESNVHRYKKLPYILILEKPNHNWSFRISTLKLN